MTKVPLLAAHLAADAVGGNFVGQKRLPQRCQLLGARVSNSAAGHATGWIAA